MPLIIINIKYKTIKEYKYDIMVQHKYSMIIISKIRLFTTLNLKKKIISISSKNEILRLDYYLQHFIGQNNIHLNGFQKHGG